MEGFVTERVRRIDQVNDKICTEDDLMLTVWGIREGMTAKPYDCPPDTNISA
ncbi:hypothetical protein Misp01_41490 [Microtetraspora sp. NBRC 13810]|nr:hypothetical protein Misp01_41490 [Microtetraspora sp. NBRC 13810]